MVISRRNKAPKRVQDLPASSKRAKGVKGGVIAIIAPARKNVGAGQLPAIQKGRE